MINNPHQADNVSQDMFVGEDLSLLSLCKLLQVRVSLVQQQVDQITESLLEEDREH